MQILLYSSPRLSPAGVATNSELSPSSVGKTEYRIKQPPCWPRIATWVGNGADVLVERALTDALGHTPATTEFEQARQLFNSYYAQTAEHGSALFPRFIEYFRPRQCKQSGKHANCSGHCGVSQENF